MRFLLRIGLLRGASRGREKGNTDVRAVSGGLPNGMLERSSDDVDFVVLDMESELLDGLLMSLEEIDVAVMLAVGRKGRTDAMVYVQGP